MMASGLVSRYVVSMMRCFEFLPHICFKPLLATVLKQVALGMMPQLPGGVAADLAERGGVEAEVTAHALADEAKFIFKAVQAVGREEEEEKKRRSRRHSAQDFTGHDAPTLAGVTRTLVKK